MKMKQVIIYTDGACRGNPGDGGWGAILMTGKHRKELWGGQHDTTNNQMELMAAIQALSALKKPCDVTVHTDSKYVMNGMKEWIHNWRKNGFKTAAKKPVKNAELWRQLDELCKTHTVDFQWVKGHAGHPENERADELANLGIDELEDK